MIDPKAAAGTVGGALALLVWSLLAAFVDAVAAMNPETLVLVTGATATVFTAVLAYCVPNLGSKVTEAIVKSMHDRSGLPTLPPTANVELSDAMPSEAHWHGEDVEPPA